MTPCANLREASRRAMAVWTPPPRMTVAEWAEAKRHLSPEASAEPGKWQNRRAPHTVKPMESLSPSDPCETVILKWSSQVGKTECLNNAVGYVIDQDPGPCLVIQPNVKPMGEAWSKDRLAPMLRDTPCLRGKLRDTNKLASDNTILHKKFPGGHLTIGGANSPSGLASRPIRYLFCDEIDRYEATKEGSSIKLAKKRTATFWNRKVLYVSSPTYEKVGIDAEYDAADQQFEWRLKCAHCEETQFPQFRHFVFDKETIRKTGHVEYVCETCGGIHHSDQEHRLKLTGEWVQVRDEGWRSKAYWMNQFGSPFVRWADTIIEFLDAKDDPERLQTVINTAFAETWKEPGETVDEGSIRERCEDYGTEVPDGVLFLTFGADVQQDRIELEVVGWGLGEESWSIDYQALPGDPTDGAVWADLSQYLGSSFGAMSIGAGCVDSGYLPTEVYSWVQSQRRAALWATKGMAGEARPFIEPRTARAMRLRRLKQTTYRPEILGVDEAKTLLYRRLRLKGGAGSCHFPVGRDDEYFAQIAAEKRVTRLRKGHQVIEWIKENARNEALDCRVLAHAALRLYLQINRITLETIAQRRVEAAEKAEETEQMQAPRKRTRRNFVNNWT